MNHVNEFFSRTNLHAAVLDGQEFWCTDNGGDTDVNLWEEPGHHWKATVCPLDAKFKTYNLGTCRGPRTALDELNRQRAAELKAEFESSGYWQSGYVDSDGNAHEFDHAQDYEDALGQVSSQVWIDEQYGEITASQEQYANAVIDNANDGDPVEIDLGNRHYFVREVGVQHSDEMADLARMKEHCEALFENLVQGTFTDEYLQSQLEYEQQVEHALNQADDGLRARMVDEHRDAISSVWLQEHGFGDGYDFDQREGEGLTP